MASPVISFQDYGFQYMAQSEPTLHHINLDIYPGEKVLIAGTSGSGKSTIGNCINGLIPFAYPGNKTGRLLVDGKVVEQSSIFELSHTVGTVLQDTDGQFIGLTVGEDIAFALENDCVPQDEMKQTVDKSSGSAWQGLWWKRSRLCCLMNLWRIWTRQRAGPRLN